LNSDIPLPVATTITMVPSSVVGGTGTFAELYLLPQSFLAPCYLWLRLKLRAVVAIFFTCAQRFFCPYGCSFVGRGIRAVAFVYTLPAGIYMFAIHPGFVDPIDVSTAPTKPLIPERHPHLCCHYLFPHLVWATPKQKTCCNLN
jgi:hypothetical protein